MWPTKYYLSLICFLVIINTIYKATAQRNLYHWKRDLEYRLTQYENQHRHIQNIIKTSIYATQGPHINGPVLVNSNGNVRFSDLVIPYGALVLESFAAQRSVKIMRDKTHGYVDSKMNELFQIQAHLEDINRRLQSQQYIYKSHRGTTTFNNTTSRGLNWPTSSKILGTRAFKQIPYAHQVQSYNVTLRQINYTTNVDKVIDDTYMRNSQYNLVDSENRLFFEGRKTFWNAVFLRPLKSGCCDRLKPLHTSRMMLRSNNQDVFAPVMIHSRDGGRPTAIIRQLTTNQMFNSVLNLTGQQQQPPIRPGDSGLYLSPRENVIRLPSLININLPNQPEVLKTIIFKDTVNIDEIHVKHSPLDGRLVIGVSSMAGFQFDLSHENYLLKFIATKGELNSHVQHVRGPLVVASSSHFVANLEADTINGINNFNRFIHESLVRIDRPAIIRGSVQFNALPAQMTKSIGSPDGAASGRLSSSPQNVVVMHVGGGPSSFEVGLVNGMRIPNDIILLPEGRYYNQRGTLQPQHVIHVRGFRQFVNQVTFQDQLNVSGLINNIQMPRGVIPLHLNDFMATVGHSNLWFMDGLNVQHITTQSGQFDRLNLRDVHGDAQSIIMRSVLANGPQGSLLIRAPMRVINVALINKNNQPNRGLLNGLRPQDILELWPPAHISSGRVGGGAELLHGRKTFLAPVEVDECIFNDINQVANWTNHLIRIDRPHTVQTIHSRLSFTRPSSPVVDPMRQPQNSSHMQQQQQSSMNVFKLRVEFAPEKQPIDYSNNWHFSPHFYMMNQALMSASVGGNSGGRYRVLNQVNLISPSTMAVNNNSSRSSGHTAGYYGGLINDIALSDIVTVDIPFKFADTFVLVGKVEIMNSLRANRMRSNYPIDAMDLVQFEKYRIPIIGSRTPIQLTNLVLGGRENQASFVQCRMLNGIPFDDFANSIMSLTRPQVIDTSLIFNSPVQFEAPVRTQSGLNGIKNFRQFASNLKNARYSLENGLQCNSVIIS